MIPKVIHMCHKQMDKLKQYSQNWLRLNPEYELRLYDDKMCEDFLLENFSQLHCDIFKYIHHGSIKCDFWRLCVIFKLGGIYADADIEPLVPLSEFISKDADFVTCMVHPGFYNPHFIISKSGNKYLKKCIELYLEYYHTQRTYSYENWSIVGIFNQCMCIDFSKKTEGSLYDMDGEKYQFLCNAYPDTNKWKGEHAQWNGRRVFNNRYPNYEEHVFLS